MANIDELLAKHGAYDVSEEEDTKKEEVQELTGVDSLLAKHGAYDVPTKEPLDVEPETDSNIFAEEGTLKKADLKQGQNAADIRNYMIKRFGVDYRVDGNISDDDMVEDFFNHMRGFNTNLLSTAGEVRWVSNASDEDKEAANRAFQLYDSTGSVFTNDGIYGAIDGVRDYMWAAAKDPSNYIGLLTGGLAKTGALGAGVGGKAAVRAAIKTGRKEYLRKLAEEGGEQAAKEAGKKFNTQLLKRMSTNGMTSKSSKEAAYNMAVQESRLARRELARQALREAQQEVLKPGVKREIMLTTAIDGTLAALNDIQIQSVYQEIDPEYQYSVGQTAFSSLLGTVAGGAQLAFGSFKGASGLADAKDAQRIASARAENAAKADELIAKEGRILSEAQEKAAIKHITDTTRSWVEKVKGSKNIHEADLLARTPTDFLSDLVLGPNRDGKGDSLVGIYNRMRADKKAAGINVKVDRNIRVSDLMTNVLTRLSDDQITQINNDLKSVGSGFDIGDLSSLRTKLSDLLAGDASDAGKTLNVWSQARKLTDAALLRTDDVAAKAVIGVVEREKEKATRMKGFTYGQNVWRRMLVSSVSTTAVNVAGFSQYYVGSTLADVLSGTGLTLAGIATPGQKGLELRRLGKIYMNTVAQKARYLLDPYTTHDTYMEFLKQNQAVSKVLFETITGGVERTAERYGIDPTKKWYQTIESVANGASMLTGVRIQDSFTKSQMFMAEMDKYLKLKHATDLMSVLKSGDTSLIDDDVIGAALDTTMKSVFSKDYTTDDQLLSAVAKQVEGFSNLPVLGTILPFGRFMNNTIATAYQWSVGGAVPVMSAIVNKEKRNISTLEAASRSVVGVSALMMAMRFDEEQQDAELPYYQIDAGNGKLVDVKNMFPASLWLALGRAANLGRKEGMVPKEIQQDILNQLAVGQFASDIQFGNDLYAVFNVFTAADDPETVKASLDALYQKSGSFLAGFTRPLDSINKMVGYINNTDAAIDKRQATGLERGSLEATKYIKNIVETVIDDMDGVSGEELRGALREGPMQDPNPMSSLFGIKVVPKRTEGEVIYAISEQHPWMANSRTDAPIYDKLFNERFAPIFNKASQELLSSERFQKASLADKRTMVKNKRNEIKAQLNRLMEDYGTGNVPSERLRAKLARAGTAEQRVRAKEFMKERGVEGPMSDWTMKQLQMYDAFLKLDREYFKD